jgi:hypothetical protein
VQVVDQPETRRGRQGAADPPDNTREAVLRWLTKQGYAIEHETAARFNDAGFVARQGLTYRDTASEKVRDVDVVARLGPHGTTANVEVHAVAECKFAPRAWVARTSDARLRKGHVEWLPFATPALRNHLRADRTGLGQVPVPLPFAFDLIEAHRQPGDANSAHDALLQVSSAAAGIMADRERFPKPFVVHPIVVVKGALFVAAFTEREPDLQAVDRIRLHWSGTPHVDAPVLVDVVSLDSFRDYLQWVRPQLYALLNALEASGRDFDDHNRPLVAWG